MNNVEAEPAVNGSNIRTIYVRCLIVAVNAAKFYDAVGPLMTPQSMHYGSVLSDFKVKWDAYEDLRIQDYPKVPKVNYKDQDRKIIRWAPIFLDCLSSTYGYPGPLRYVLRDNTEVPGEDKDPLLLNNYYGQRGVLLEKLIEGLPHERKIFKNNNTTVYMIIEKAVQGYYVESTIKSYSHKKDGCSAFRASISNDAGETKYCGIMKKKVNLLQNIKWNGRTYPLETHITNHRQAFEIFRKCSEHITMPVPDQSQIVEYLIGI